jgi:aryl-alcohol dehydrogenase-like predicted oxidoreductase
MKFKPLGDTGVLVSELCLGTMTFGGRGMWALAGKQQLDETTELITKFVDAGGNFFDTANAYSEGESELLLGASIEKLGLNRLDLILATKVRLRMGEGKNNVGLSRLHIMQQIDASLKRLNTDYIDLYQIHGVDPLTPLEETMRGLEDVVRSGKVRYIGCSNLAGWQIMKANMIAEKNGWTKFISTQNLYTLAARDIEREIIPVVEDQKMGILPWSPLAGGLLSGKFDRHTVAVADARRTSIEFPIVDKDRAFDVIDTLKIVAQRQNASVAQVALSWLLHQKTVASVIIGAKTMAQLEDNIKSKDIVLTTDDLAQLNEVSALPGEYPNWIIHWQAADRV